MSNKILRIVILTSILAVCLLCCISVADSGYQYVTQFGTIGTGDGQFKGPTGIVVNSTGCVYVVDTENHRVQYFTPGGDYLGKFSSGSSCDISVNSTGYPYVVDSGNNLVYYFTPGGNYLGQWGGSGTGNGKFDYPGGIAINSTGCVFVADLNNDRIQYFTPGGNYLGQWGGSGTGDGQFKYPRGVAVNSTGYIYVTESENNRIQYFTPGGDYLGQWGSTGSNNGQFDNPCGIVVNSTGYVFVTDINNLRVQYFTSDGDYLGKIGFASVPYGISVNTTGYLYVTNPDNAVQVFAPHISVSSITPDSGIKTDLVPVTITGTGFLSGAIVNLTMEGQTPVTATNVQVDSLSQITCTIPVTSAPGGTWNVHVKNTNGNNSTLSNGFTIKNPQPVISGISPTNEYVNIHSTDYPVTVTGTNFVSGSTATLNGNARAVTFTDSAHITITFLKGDDDTAGSFPVIITNPSPSVGASSPVNYVVASYINPVISKISPVSGQQGGAYTLTITGTDFEPDKSTVSVSGGGVTVKSYPTRTTEKIVCKIAFSTSAKAGKRTVTVKNPTSGKTATKTFTVYAGPTITKISPTKGQKGKTIPLIITGSHFEAKQSLVSFSGTGLSVKSYPSRTTNKIICNVAISTAAATGKRTLTVKNPTGGGIATKPFTVSGPSVTKISPASGQKGKTITLTITGTGFESGKSTVTVSGSGVSVKSYPTRTTKKIVCKVVIASTAKTGERTITVKNPASGGVGTGSFTITAKTGAETETAGGQMNSVVLSSPVSGISSPVQQEGISQVNGLMIPVNTPVII